METGRRHDRYLAVVALFERTLCATRTAGRDENHTLPFGLGAWLETFAEEAAMQAKDLMSRDVVTVLPQTLLQRAARLMLELDIGALPVRRGDRLVGMVTDRDLAVRALAQGHGPDATVGDVMTRDVKYCFADQDVDEVAANMADLQLRRLPVLDHDKRLVGILSLCDIAVSDDIDQAAEALSGISRHSSPTLYLPFGLL
jgi:CBS domain-containing protein